MTSEFVRDAWSETLAGKEVTIHIGLPKTGTTSLQEQSFMGSDAVHYVGRPLHDAFRAVDRFLRTLTEVDELDYSRGVAAFRKASAPLFRTDCPHILISDEELSAGSVSGPVGRWTIAERLRGLFPDARIVVVLRDQRSALQSLYAYAMCIPGQRRIEFNDWVRGIRDDLPFGRGARLFEYDVLLARYAALFGAGRIGAFFYEDYRADPRAFLADLERFSGLPAGALAPTGHRRVNARPTRNQTRLASLRRRLPELDGLVERLPPRAVEALNALAQTGPEQAVSYAEDTDAFVGQFFGPSNARLLDSELLGDRAQSLVRHDYPLTERLS